jgi:ferredoxin-type protein NapH
MEETQKKPLTAAQKRQRTLKHRAWLRAGVQAFFFLTMPGAFVAGFSGVKHLFQWIGASELLQVDSFVLSLIGLCGFTILFGRFFCGYVCAFGGLGDFVYWLSGVVQKKIFHRKKQLQFPTKVVRFGQKVKYLVLLLIVALCVFNVYSKTSGMSPWDVFSRLTALKLPAAGYGIGIALFVLILVGMAFQPRFFCQFLCPMGAVFALLPVLPFAQLQRDNSQCIPGCSACEKRCPVDLKLNEANPRSGECIACEACVSTCPRGNISRWDLKLAGKYFWIPVLAKAVLFFAMGACLGFCRFF